LIASEDLIAGILNRNGLKTGHGNRWSRERVTSLRSHHRIPVFKAAADGVEPWLNLSDAAHVLEIASKTLRLAAEAGEIDARHPLSEGPWIFARAELMTDNAVAGSKPGCEVSKRTLNSCDQQAAAGGVGSEMERSAPQRGLLEVEGRERAAVRQLQQSAR
jgi:hypothetical protein